MKRALMALLAAFLLQKAPGETLEDFLSRQVFAQAVCTTLVPDAADVAGFDRYMESYRALLQVESKAVEVM